MDVKLQKLFHFGLVLGLLVGCSPFDRYSLIDFKSQVTLSPLHDLKIQGNVSDKITTSRNNTVILNMADAKEVLLTESPDCVSGGQWQSYSNNLPITISSGDGLKTVYVGIKKTDNTISCQSAQITLDTTPPRVTITNDNFLAKVTALNANSFPLTGTCSEEGKPVIIRNYTTELASTNCINHQWAATINVSADFATTARWFLSANQTDDAQLESEYQAWATKPKSSIVEIVATCQAFAALRQDGSVSTWGDSYYGGDSSAVQSQLVGVIQIYSTETAFAALKTDGSVVTWGYSDYGGDSSSVQAQLVNVSQIYSTSGAFAAVKSDGTVVTWGGLTSGGDSSMVPSQLVGVSQIYSTGSGAFAALKSDGTVVTWGDSVFGGDSSSVQSQLVGVSQIYSTGTAFAALKSDGSVVTWGDSTWGGDSSSVQSHLTNVTQIHSLKDGSGFVAITSDGKLVLWGGSPSEVKTGIANIQSLFIIDIGVIVTQKNQPPLIFGSEATIFDKSTNMW